MHANILVNQRSTVAGAPLHAIPPPPVVYDFRVGLEVHYRA